MKTLASAVLVAAATLAAPAAASAQTDKWSPWLGCWSLVTEDVHEGLGSARAAALSPLDAPLDAPLAPPESVPRVCVVRSGNGVMTTTTAPGQSPVTESIEADGPPRPISDGECTGSERTEWSRNGKRLFAQAEVSCADQSLRMTSGLGLITSSGDWLDVRSVRIDGRHATRVSRYRRLTGVSTRGSALTIDEIKEAAGKVSPAVLEAAIAETRPRLGVNKKALIDLANARVPVNVIDVIVATSYPEHFVVDSPQRGPAPDTFAYGAAGSVYETYIPTYYYSPFAYGYIGRYDPYQFPAAWYPVGGGGGGAGDLPRESGTGKAVNGQGYTRIRPAESAQSRPTNTGRTSNGQPTGGDNQPAFVSQSGNSGSSSSSAGSSPPPSSSPGGGDSGAAASTASPQGFSSGGDSGGSGRMAQPR